MQHHSHHARKFTGEASLVAPGYCVSVFLNVYHTFLSNFFYLFQPDSLYDTDLTFPAPSSCVAVNSYTGGCSTGIVD
jgi:hypothetical protein